MSVHFDLLESIRLFCPNATYVCSIFRPHMCVLGNVPGTSVYRDIATNRTVSMNFYTLFQHRHAVFVNFRLSCFAKCVLAGS